MWEAKNKRLQVELTLMKIAHLPGVLNWDGKKKELKSDTKSDSQVSEPAQNTPQAESKPEVSEPEKPIESTERKEEITSSLEEAENEVKPTEKAAVEEAENKPKPYTDKTSKSKGLNLNIKLSKLRKKEFEVKKDEAQEEEILAPNESIEPAQLSEAWVKTQEEYKSTDPVFFPILEHSEARLEAGEVVLVFDALGSKELFTSKSEEVLGKFFKHLGCKAPVKSIVEKAMEEKAPKKAFTSKDKLALLEEKNPNLKILKEKLQLYIKD